jgi:hypothetical protein
MKKIFLISFLLLFLGIVNVQAAEPLVTCGPGSVTGKACDFCDLFGMINNILRQIFTWVVPGVAGLMLMVGGVLFFLSGSKPEMVNQAKGVIMAAIIGMVVIFAAWVAINYIFSNIGVMDISGWKWYDIQCKTP